MAIKLTADSFLAVLKQSSLIEPAQLERLLEEFKQRGIDLDDSRAIADAFVASARITRWQADKLLQGKHQGFLLGKYRLLSLLGKGGMSSVYLAEHMVMRRRCAIKVLPAKRVNDSSYLGRFHREAQAVASLDHPNIVRAYDVDKQIENGAEVHFLVMEYVDGQSLHELVHSRGPLPYDEAADYIRQAALGLEHAHDAGMVHRDIKPGNLLVDRSGTVRLLDLGLARFFEEKDEQSLTVAHEEKVLGTADYLAPEQALDSHQVDSRADIYSLGCTLYFLLTGHAPFMDGTLAQRLMAHQTKQPPPVPKDRPDAPPSLVAIINRMMAKQADQRYQSAIEVSKILASWLTDNGGEEWRHRLPPAAESGPDPSSEFRVFTMAPPDTENNNMSATALQLPESPDDVTLKPLDEDDGAARARAAASKAGPKPDSSVRKSGEFSAKPLSDSHRGRRDSGDRSAAGSDVMRKRDLAAKLSDSSERKGPTRKSDSNVRPAPGRTPPSAEIDALSDEPSDAVRTMGSPAYGASTALPPRLTASRQPRKSDDEGFDFKILLLIGGSLLATGAVVAGGFMLFRSSFFQSLTSTPSAPPGTPSADPANTAPHPGGDRFGKKFDVQDDSQQPPPNAEALTQPAAAPAPPVDAPSSRAWEVGPGKRFETILAALESARDNYRPADPGDRLTITVAPGTYPERLLIDNVTSNWPRGIRLVAADSGPVVLAPSGPEPVISLRGEARNQLTALTIEGFQITAADKPQAIHLAGHLPGTTLRRIQIDGFGDAGIVAFASLGAIIGSLNIEAVTFTNSGPDAVGIRLESETADPAFMEISTCRFLGPMAAGIDLTGGAKEVKIQQSIFFNLKSGIRVRGGEKAVKSLQIKSNTFHQVAAGLEFDMFPGENSEETSLIANIFGNVSDAEVVVRQGFDIKRFTRLFEKRRKLAISTNCASPRSPGLPEGSIDLLMIKGAANSRNPTGPIMFQSENPDDPQFLVPKPDEIYSSFGARPLGAE